MVQTGILLRESVDRPVIPGGFYLLPGERVTVLVRDNEIIGLTQGNQIAFVDKNGPGFIHVEGTAEAMATLSVNALKSLDSYIAQSVLFRLHIEDGEASFIGTEETLKSDSGQI